MIVMRKALVIGGCGFIGSCVVNALLESGWKVNVLDLIKSDKILHNNAQTFTGNINDTNVLEESMVGVDSVFYFASHTIPSQNKNNLSDEITYSLTSLNQVLGVMVEHNIKNIFFPSSGGTVYGNILKESAEEEDQLAPESTYGMGKVLCEKMLDFYSRNFSINVTILRIANIYGCPFYRTKQQGVIDIFIQNILKGDSIVVWGNAKDNIRDYIYVKDFCQALLMLVEKERKPLEIYNVGSGSGSSLQEVLDCISSIMGENIPIIHKKDIYSGVSKNILNINKLSEEIGWKPKYSLYEGIKETILEKKNNMKE